MRDGSYNPSWSHHAMLGTACGCSERKRVRLLQGSREKSRTPASPGIRQSRQEGGVRPRETCLWVPHMIIPRFPTETAVRVANLRVGGAREVTHDRGSSESARKALPKRAVTGSTAKAHPDGSPKAGPPIPILLAEVGSGVSARVFPPGCHKTAASPLNASDNVSKEHR